MTAKTQTTQVQKEIKTDFIKAVNERNSFVTWEAKKKAYSDRRLLNRKAKQKRKARIEKIKVVIFTILFTIIGLLLVYGCSGIIISNANEIDQYVYSMQGELQGNCVVLEDGHCHEVDRTYANYTSKAKSVTVVLDNNGTEDVEDDIILNIY